MLGEVPSGWTREPLRNVGQFLKCQGGSKKDDVSAGVPVVRYGQLYTRYDTVIREFYTFVDTERATAYTPLERGDVLFAGSGETLGDIGKGAVVLSDGGARGSGDLILLRPSPTVDPLFLGYAINSPDAVAQKVRLGQGSSIYHISADRLAGVSIAVPPLPEQKKIAAILSSVDEAIQATQAVIDQTRRVKEGLLQDLLTRGIGHTRFKQTEIGEIPEGWEVRRLDELLSDGPRNGVYKTAGDIGHGTLIIGQTAFTSDRTVDCAAARRARATEDDLARYGLRPKDILITRVYATQEGCGRPAMVTDLPEPAIYESNMMRIRVNEQQSTSGFLFHWLLHPVARRCLMSKSSSSNQTSINQETLGGLACPQPTLREQESILSVLAACDEHVTRARRELAVLTTTKSGLLTDLLTGKVRVTP